MVKFLGIDYGAKRVGLAISDENGRLAFPFKILQNNKELFDSVHNICGEESIAEIIIGESVDLYGKENKIMNEIKEFVKELLGLGLPIHFQKEFMTTVEARGREGKEKNNARKIPARNAFSIANAGGKKVYKSKKVDASAAALILQRYLDKRNKN
ncbi:MAG: Holliday junction resolvase RuvX [Candidatus Paceibacterota bacterium]